MHPEKSGYNGLTYSGCCPNMSHMTQIDPRLSAFLARCDRLADRLRVSRATLSSRLLLDGKRLDDLASGRSDIGIRRLSRAERELAALEGLEPTPQALGRRASRDRREAA